MANIKLKDHYWETEGIYDAAQSKTQKAINADIAEVAQNNSDLIIMSSTQPSATGNKIWIKEGVSYQIPVMDDLISNNITNNSSVSGTNVTGALNTLGSNVSDLQGSLNAIGNLRFVSFDTTSITTQVDALGVGAFWGTVPASTVGMATTIAGVVRVLAYNANLKRIYFYPNGSDDAEYMLEKRSSWRSWITLPTRSEIDEIRNAEIPTAVTISSVHENVTINSQKVYQTGRLVVVAMNVTISQDITSSSQLLYGFPASVALTAFSAITNGGAHGCNIRSNGYLYNDGAITAGSWYINVTYITAS